MWPRITDFFFPPFCLACHAPLPDASQGLCASCTSSISRDSNLRCGECFARLPEGKKICHKKFPYILGAATRYHDARIRALIHGLKFHHAHAAATTLAEITVRYCRDIPLPLQSFTILPIPLSTRRERERGYNHSELIATRIGAALELPVATDILVRTLHTQPQSHLPDWDARRKNIAGAFIVPVTSLAQGKNFILLDDVITSGSTFFEASTALKHAGARRIVALATTRA
ncbi:MAG: ComF family protein [Patescibacteria group bacterium]|nr:ComF family protein [Patescibacteria group bacterium]